MITEDMMDELQYDFIIVDIVEHILPSMTREQLEKLAHACEVEIRENHIQDIKEKIQ